MTKNILSIGAGLPQLDFIKALKKRNYSVIAIGKGRNADEVIALCDDFAEVDTHNLNEAIQWALRYPKKIDAVGSFAGGNAIGTLQEICRALNLPTRIPDHLMVGMDKFSQQALYEKYGLTTIKSWTAKEILNNKQEPRSIEHFIIKPVIGRGSSGVNIVNSSTLLNMVDKGEIDASTIIQEFRKGEEYRVSVLVQGGEIKLLAPILRVSFDKTFFLGRLSYSSRYFERIEEYFINFIDRCRLTDVILKADVLISDKHIDMIEMDIGVGGGTYYKQYISALFNYDFINQYINLITQSEVEKATLPEVKWVMDYIYNKTGKPFSYNIEYVSQRLDTIIGKHKIIQNLLQPEKTGKLKTNADFIFTVIHQNEQVNNRELNEYLNSTIFSNA